MYCTKVINETTEKHLRTICASLAYLVNGEKKREWGNSYHTDLMITAGNTCIVYKHFHYIKTTSYVLINVL